MRIFAIIVLFTVPALSVGGVKKHANPHTRRMVELAASPGFCSRAITSQDIVANISQSENFKSLAKPQLVPGLRYLKLLVTRMADGSIEAAYGPMTMGIFLAPAIQKLSYNFTMRAIAADNQTSADEERPIRALWVGEIETFDGVLTKATFRELREFPNDESVMEEFLASRLCPWAVPPTFRLTRLKSNEHHLKAFMNLPGALSYNHYYDHVGDALSAVARAFTMVQRCLDRGDLECAQTEFRDVARLARDGETKDSRAGLIIPFEGLVRDDGFTYPNEKNQDRFRLLIENASINTERVSREDMEYFHRAVNWLSAVINLSRPNAQPRPEVLQPLIYILQDGAFGTTEPKYD